MTPAARVPSTTSVAPLVRWVRHERVLLDFDVAAMYGVETRVLKQAVRRHRGRFPRDFMFELTAGEAQGLVSQSVIPGLGKLGGALPFAFTEGGIAMLSSVLHSARAVEVNIAVMRTFAELRRLVDPSRELSRRIESLEQRYDERFAAVFAAIKRMIADGSRRRSRRRIGFLPDPRKAARHARSS